MLRSTETWNEATYKELMLARLINDHTSVGPAPHLLHSYFPYTLAEPDFVLYRFKVSAKELAAFNEAVEEIGSLT